MELPSALRVAVDALLEGEPLGKLQEASARLTQRYRAETRDERLHLHSELAAKAYLAARLPATFAAIRSAMDMTSAALPDFAPQTLLDVGAGPGTALWAAQDCWPSLNSAQMLEASSDIMSVGQTLSSALPAVQSQWTSGDAARDLSKQPPADLVSLSYVLDELPPEQMAPLARELWSLTTGLLLIIEPGTPAGWQRILIVREALINAGAQITAPCAHAQVCPIIAPDWCHFSRRVARSRIHRLVKGGDVPWEDEKFIFIAASRAAPEQRASRILAPPRTGKAWIDLKLCQPDGSVGAVQISKRDGDAYRVARRADWGDAFEAIA